MAQREGGTFRWRSTGGLAGRTTAAPKQAACARRFSESERIIRFL